jgi:ankyrin repeat protein
MVCYRSAIKLGLWDRTFMNSAKYTLAALAAMLLAQPASAQSLGSENFVAAVRDRDGGKAMEILRTKGPLVLNTRDDKGETALTIAIARRDDQWTGFLLSQGADPNQPGRNGETPLIAAARIGFLTAAADLIRARVKVDAANRMGETALIVAVQGRHVSLVKLLLDVGANPDKADSAAGYSARDYAKRDARSREILKLIEAKTPPPKA